jgi:SOS-response transcriptional repressor LexA
MQNYEIRYRPQPPRGLRWDMLSHDEILAEMIRQFEAGKITLAQVARHLTIAPARVTEMKKGDRKIQPTEMHKLAEFLGMTSVPTPTQAIESIRKIPILGKVAAGVWMEQTYVDEDFIETIEYDRLPGDGNPEDMFAVIPEGASMNQTIPANMILICRRVPFGFSGFKENQLVIVERENHNLREMTCKRLKYSESGDFLLCSESDRPEFAEPFFVKRSTDHEFVDMEISIIGVVIRGVVDFQN